MCACVYVLYLKVWEEGSDPTVWCLLSVSAAAPYTPKQRHLCLPSGDHKPGLDVTLHAVSHMWLQLRPTEKVKSESKKTHSYWDMQTKTLTTLAAIIIITGSNLYFQSFNVNKSICCSSLKVLVLFSWGSFVLLFVFYLSVLFQNLLNNVKICPVWLTHPWEQSVERCGTPSQSAPPSGHRQGILQVPASGSRLHFLTVTSETPPGPKAPPLHMTEAAVKCANREEVNH